MCWNNFMMIEIPSKNFTTSSKWLTPSLNYPTNEHVFFIPNQTFSLVLDPVGLDMTCHNIVILKVLVLVNNLDFE